MSEKELSRLKKAIANGDGPASFSIWDFLACRGHEIELALAYGRVSWPELIEVKGYVFGLLTLFFVMTIDLLGNRPYPAVDFILLAIMAIISPRILLFQLVSRTQSSCQLPGGNFGDNSHGKMA